MTTTMANRIEARWVAIRPEAAGRDHQPGRGDPDHRSPRSIGDQSVGRAVVGRGIRYRCCGKWWIERLAVQEFDRISQQAVLVYFHPFAVQIPKRANLRNELQGRGWPGEDDQTPNQVLAGHCRRMSFQVFIVFRRALGCLWFLRGMVSGHLEPPPPFGSPCQNQLAIGQDGALGIV